MNCAERGQINIAKVTCSQIFVNVNETKRLLQSAFWGIVCTIRREGSCLAHRAPSFVASDRQNVEQFVHLDAFDEKFCVVWAAARRKGSLGRGVRACLTHSVHPLTSNANLFSTTYLFRWQSSSSHHRTL